MSRRDLVVLMVCMTPLWVASVVGALIVAQAHPDGLPVVHLTHEQAWLWNARSTVIRPWETGRLVTVGLGTLVTAGAVVVCLAHWWSLRRQRALGTQPREWVVLAAVVGAAVSCGAFAGSLHDVELGFSFSTVAVYSIFVPTVLLAVALSPSVARAVPRVLVFALSLHAAASLSYAYGQFGEDRGWNHSGALHTLSAVCGLVLIAVAGWARAIFFARPRWNPESPLAPRRAE